MLNKMIQKILIVIVLLVVANIQTELVCSQIQPSVVIHHNEQYISDFTFSHDSTKILTVYGELNIWDANTGLNLQHIVPLYGVCAAFSPDDQMVATGGGPLTGSIVDLKMERVVRTFSGPIKSGPVNYISILFTQDGKSFFTGQEDGEIFLWDVATGEGTKIFDIGIRVKSMQIFPDGKRLLAMDKIISIPDGEILHVFEGSPFLTFDRRKIFLIHGFGGSYQYSQISEWDANTYEKLKEYPVFEPKAEFLGFSPDGKLLMFNKAVSPTIQSHMLEVESNTGVRNFTPAGEEMYEFERVKFSPDGKKMATVGVAENTLRIWDISDLTSQVGSSKNF